MSVPYFAAKIVSYQKAKPIGYFNSMLIKLQRAYESPGILVKDFDLADLS